MDKQAASLLLSAHLYGTRKRDAVEEGLSAGPALTHLAGPELSQHGSTLGSVPADLPPL